MYREMTAEEKLNFISEITEATKTGGLISALDVFEKHKKLLFINNEVNVSVEDKIKTPIEHEVAIEENNLLGNKAGEASIYAEEHIPAVQDDLREYGLVQSITKNEVEQPKAKILEPPKNTSPNPWGSAKIVSPGELNLQQ